MLGKKILLSILNLGVLCAMESEPHKEMLYVSDHYSQKKSEEMAPKEREAIKVLRKIVEEDPFSDLDDYFKNLNIEKPSEPFSYAVLFLCLKNNCLNALETTLPEKFRDRFLVITEEGHASHLLEIALLTNNRDTLGSFFIIMENYAYFRPKKEKFLEILQASLGASAKPKESSSLNKGMMADYFVDFLVSGESGFSLDDTAQTLIKYIENSLLDHDFKTKTTLRGLLQFLCKKGSHETAQIVLLEFLRLIKKEKIHEFSEHIKKISKVLGDKVNP
jgi:hypothetical protein